MRPYVFERNRCILKVNNRKGVSNPHTHVERSESANAGLSKSSHTIRRGDVSLDATTSEWMGWILPELFRDFRPPGFPTFYEEFSGKP